MNTKNKMYVSFDPQTGRCLGCSGTRIANSVEIDSTLGEKFIMGTQSLSNYEVCYDAGSYFFRKKGVMVATDANTFDSQSKVVNSNVYLVPTVKEKTAAIIISLDKIARLVEFSISDKFRNTLKTVLIDDKNKTHQFFCCRKNDATQLIQTFVVDLKEIYEKSLVMHTLETDYEVDFYCRKIYDYGLVRKNG